MAYLVLAVGGLTTVIGLFLLATGYPVIEIERGWASVIAGATLTTGGLITGTLGLILRALSRMRRTMDGALPATVGSSMAGYSVPPVIAAPVEAPTIAQPEASRHSDDVPALVLPDPHAADTLFGAPTRSSEHAAPAAPQADDVATAPLSQPADEVQAFHSVEEVVPSPLELPPADEPSPAPSHAPSETEPTHPPGPAAETSHFDLEPEAAPESSPSEESIAAPLAHSEPVTEAPRHDEPAAEPTPNLEPTSAVIGRYEADGTSYVMYADGSIEAQSPAGVYRFASMAELKSFIEG